MAKTPLQWGAVYRRWSGLARVHMLSKRHKNFREVPRCVRGEASALAVEEAAD